MRILDLDLDFFQDGAAAWVDPDGDRRDPDEYPPWPLEEALAFLENRCLLTEALPGAVLEHHSDLFYLLGEWIQAGGLTAPFELVHLDAHADLGLGDSGYVYILSELAFEPMRERSTVLGKRRPASREGLHEFGSDQLGDGNWLAFALACGWLADLTYVSNTNGPKPDDWLPYLMKDFDRHAGHLQVCAVEKRELDNAIPRINYHPRTEKEDPSVPFTPTSWRNYQATEPFDLVCLTRSPAYTSPDADRIFDVIRERFVDEHGF